MGLGVSVQRSIASQHMGMGSRFWNKAGFESMLGSLRLSMWSTLTLCSTGASLCFPLPAAALSGHPLLSHFQAEW